jgi:hypothetical protein
MSPIQFCRLTVNDSIPFSLLSLLRQESIRKNTTRSRFSGLCWYSTAWTIVRAYCLRWRTPPQLDPSKRLPVLLVCPSHLEPVIPADLAVNWQRGHQGKPRFPCALYTSGSDDSACEVLRDPPKLLATERKDHVVNNAGMLKIVNQHLHR